MKKVAAVVQARTTSHRLPQKVLATLSGLRVIDHVINAIKEASLIDEIILATSSNKEDDILCDIAKQHNVKFVRGTEDDVLGRFILASKITDADIFIRHTADDPLLDPYIIDRIVGFFLKTNTDYVSNILERSWPRGMDTEVFSREALIRCDKLSKEKEHREHVTLFIRMNPELFSLKNIKSPKSENFPNIRLCVDTYEDYEMMSKIFNALYEEGIILRVQRVIKFLHDHPEVLEINSTIEQKKVFGKVF